ncbi:MAG: DUF1848 domain-containing protein [Clostridiaceae bacterium]|nr:DUF1848 domain-containing protein [Clostridiaceae bacterium]
MIISVSRRTDIPAFFTPWFLRRLQAGFVWVPNPLNPRQISQISLLPEDVDCFVFWSKNFRPLLERLSGLENRPFYCQFTLNDYGCELEGHVPPLQERIATFQALADRIGPERIIWRYDPMVLSSRYTPDYHAEHFAGIARRLSGYTRQCVISFVDRYRKIESAWRLHHLIEWQPENMMATAVRLAAIAGQNGLSIKTCAETLDFTGLGIEPARCVDDRLIAKILGRPFVAAKDKNQRDACGCVSSVDIGMYDTCLHGCSYCYANSKLESIRRNVLFHDPESPLLCGQPDAGAKISIRKER